MGVIAKQSFNTTIAIYLGLLIGIVNRIYFFPKYITESELGLYTVLFVLATILTQFSFLGTSTTFTKYYAYFQNKNKENEFLGFILSVPLLGFFIFSMLFIVFKDEILSYYSKNDTLLENSYFFIFPLAFFLILNRIFTIYSNNNLKITIPSIASNFVMKLLIMFGLILLSFSIIDFNGFLYYNVLAYALIFLLIATYVISKFRPSASFNYGSISTTDYKELTNYSAFVFLGSLSGTIIMHTDSLMLSSMKGFGAAGIYSIAFFAGTVIEIPKRAIISISAPIIAKKWTENDTNGIQELYRKTSINQGVIGLFLLLLLWINLDEVFYILPNSKIYSTGKYVAIIIGLTKAVDMFSGINAEILQTSIKYKINFLLIIVFIFVSVILNYFFIPIYNLNGAALASLISVSLYNFIRFIIIKKYFGFNPFTKNSIKLIILFIATLSLGLLMPKFFKNNQLIGLLTNITISSTLFGTLYLGMVYYLNISEEINNLINKQLSKWFKRK